mmetsp:Transcript_43318/g.101750  ORF Transcript_43318/g.101750 Transcript_43318/m.101750 type:complete len:230 (+) Transcript_43318:551-1240(+)
MSTSPTRVMLAWARAAFILVVIAELTAVLSVCVVSTAVSTSMSPESRRRVAGRASSTLRIDTEAADTSAAAATVALYVSCMAASKSVMVTPSVALKVTTHRLALLVLSPHSSCGEHDPTPSPPNPALHAHVKLPSAGVHVASAWQLCVSAHSSTTLHVTPPSPDSHPGLQVHVKLPMVLVHCALVPHFASDSPHSSASAHATPWPEKPSLHAQVKLPTVLMQAAAAWQL